MCADHKRSHPFRTKYYGEGLCVSKVGFGEDFYVIMIDRIGYPGGVAYRIDDYNLTTVSGTHVPPSHEGNSFPVPSGTTILIAHQKILSQYFDVFIGSIQGAYSTQLYTLPENNLTVISRPIHGIVTLREPPDDRFLMHFECSNDGTVNGELIRALDIPFRIHALEGEVEGVVHYRGVHNEEVIIPAYYSLYKNGVRCSTAEYRTYRVTRKRLIAESTGLLPELSDLLGF